MTRGNSRLGVRGVPVCPSSTRVPSYFMAMSFRCQRRTVSGVTILQHVESSLRPSAFPSTASRRRWSSLGRGRFFPSNSRRTLFSSMRYSMTAACSRFIHPAIPMSKICHGFRCVARVVTCRIRPVKRIRERRQRPQRSSESALTSINEMRRIGVGRIMTPCGITGRFRCWMMSKSRHSWRRTGEV